MARGKLKTQSRARSAPIGQSSETSGLAAAFVCLVLGTAACAVSLQTVLEIDSTALEISGDLWLKLVPALGGQLTRTPAGDIEAHAEFGPIFALLAGFSVATWLAGAWWIQRRHGGPFADAASRWGKLGWAWWIVGGSWFPAWMLANWSGATLWQGIVGSGAVFWIASGAAGWVATFLVLLRPSEIASGGGRPVASIAAAEPAPVPSLRQRSSDDYRVPLSVWICGGVYVLCFVTMNWQLYRGLLLPHGDSAMYEEHLWNLLHGKGFRSYLDQGIFLGEHVQLIHLLLIPLYVLWPSQMNLELWDSAILALGCVPVYWMARRHTGDSRAAAWLAAAYLLYFPMQFLDIGIEGKTFRPNGLGIPVLLFALDQLERGGLKTFFLLLAVTLSAQEDYAIVLAPLGVWIALRQARVRFADAAEEFATKDRHAPKVFSGSNRRSLIFGVCLTLFAVVYLIVATRVVMAYFRHGAEIHYASYFSKFGKTLPEIAKTIFTHPGLLWKELVTFNSGIYALMLLAPVGFLSLFSPGRLAVGVPLFITLCLNETFRRPIHHVHAAAVPIIFWSAAAGLAAAPRLWKRAVEIFRRMTKRVSSAGFGYQWSARFACLCALFTGAFFGLSPLSIAFWDSHSSHYWKKLYVPGKRAELFPQVLALIPDQNARVASTDFVHPRFTHYARSYDYSEYPRAVNGGKPGAPPDTDYIVIDTHGPYSAIQSPDQIREYREHPDQWELLPDTTQGYFIVLKRRR